MSVQSEKSSDQGLFTLPVNPAPAVAVAEGQVCVFPASHEQSRYWILDQLEGVSTASNMAIAFRLEGKVESGLVETSLHELVLRHEALRTTFRMVEGELSQVVAEAPQFGFSLSDFRSLPGEEAVARAEEAILEHGRTHIDLAAGPLFHARLIHVSEMEHFLAFTIHHIVCDGWSNGVLVRDFALIYAALSESRPVSLPDLPFQFADFTVWQQEWLKSDQAQTALSFWRDHVRREMPAVDLPTDAPRSAHKSAPGHIESLLLTPALTAKLKSYCRRRDATMHQILLAGFEGLISRYTDQTEFLLGSTIANRTQPGMEHVVGRFANPQIILADVEGDPSYRELVERVKGWSAKSYAHQDLPFSRLMEEFQLDQSGATSQFLQVYFVYQKAFMQPQQAGALKVIPRPSVSGGVNFDLLVSIVEREEGPRLQIEYNTQLFRKERIERLLKMYVRVLDAAMEDESLRVSQYPLLAAEERAWLALAGRDATPFDLHGESICSWLDRWTASRETATAIVEGPRQVSWRELDDQSASFAAGLLRLGVQPGQTAAIRMESSANAVAAVLAAMRVGAAVLPVPQTASVAEWNLLLLEFEPAIALACSEFAAEFHTLTSFSQLAKAAQEAGRFPPKQLPLAPERIAWLNLRTDASGYYKATPVHHEATLQAMLGASRTLGMRAGDAVLIWPAPAANEALTDLLVPLLAGCSVFYAGDLSAAAVQSLADREQVAFAIHTPAGFSQLIADGWKCDPRVHLVARGPGANTASVARLAGMLERSSVGQSGARRLGPHAGRIAWLPISPWGPGPFAVGQVTNFHPSSSSNGQATEPVCTMLPLAGHQLTVVDRYGNCSPYGVPGELRIEPPAPNSPSSAAVTSESLESFASRGSREKMNSGFLARYSPDRGFELIDARSRQIRLHGYRLRLNDLENALYRNPEIASANATILRSGAASTLAAYVTEFHGGRLLVENVGQWLRETAPGHLAAAQLIPAPAIPRRADGTANFSAMPRPGAARLSAAPTDGEPARDELEKKLVKIWEDTLGVQGIGIRTSFFSLGGYSLTIVRLFARINKAFGMSLPITTIFNAPTIEQMAGLMRGSIAYSPLVPIQPKGSLPPLFLIHSYLIYEGMRSVLGDQRPLYGLRELEGDDYLSIEERAATYVREMRSVQPSGPYFLGAWCAAGPLAVEAARQLADAGEKTAMVVLFDSWRPGYAAEFSKLQASNPNMSRQAVLKRKVRYHRLKLKPLNLRGKAKYSWEVITTKIRSSRDKLYLRHWDMAQLFLNRFGIPLPHFMHNVSLKTILSVQAFKGKPFPGRITLIRATEAPYLPQADPACGWNDLALGGVDVFFTPGTHESMFVEPNLSDLGKILHGNFERAAENQSR